MMDKDCFGSSKIISIIRKFVKGTEWQEKVPKCYEYNGKWDIEAEIFMITKVIYHLLVFIFRWKPYGNSGNSEVK